MLIAGCMGRTPSLQTSPHPFEIATVIPNPRRYMPASAAGSMYCHRRARAGLESQFAVLICSSFISQTRIPRMWTMTESAAVGGLNATPRQRGRSRLWGAAQVHAACPPTLAMTALEECRPISGAQISLLEDERGD